MLSACIVLAADVWRRDHQCRVTRLSARRPDGGIGTLQAARHQYYGNRDSELAAGPGTPDVRRRDGDAVGPAAAS